LQSQGDTFDDEETNMPRNEQEAFAWVEVLLGGRITNVERQARWRPQYFLDLDGDEAGSGGAPRRVVLRGFRNPGYTTPDVAGARAMLASEAAVLRALHDVPVRAPELLGYHDQLGWLVMEYIPGDSELTAVEDPAQRFAAMTGYVEALAQLHAHPVDKLRLDPAIPRPATAGEFAHGLLDRHEAYYRNSGLTEPEPVMELGYRWLRAHPLPSERPVCLGLTDVGPNQFLYDGSQFKALIDVEYGMVADPLMEIGMMRGRDVTYHSGRMAELVLHYGATYEQLTGIPLDLEALRWWTIAGPTLWNVFALPAAQRPDPTIIDTPFMLSYEVQQKRCTLEGLAEREGISLEPPELPGEDPMQLGSLHQALVGQFERHWPARLNDPKDIEFARYSAAMCRTLARGEATAAVIARDNLAELAEVLGHAPDGWRAGLAELTERIGADHERDLDRIVGFLHRAELRREYLYEPMQRATGVSVRQPMERIPHTDSATT
jgi:aminoglycoside phosphotransferase (APT) family kinase protein